MKLSKTRIQRVFYCLLVAFTLSRLLAIAAYADTRVQAARERFAGDPPGCLRTPDDFEPAARLYATQFVVAPHVIVVSDDCETLP